MEYRNLYYRPNSSNKSKISYRQLSRINNSLTELYPPIQFTMPRTRKASSHMGNLITKEELYEENMQLKSSLKRLKKELEESKKNLFKKGLELEKKEIFINNFVTTIFYRLDCRVYTDQGQSGA